jgi:hypothetical protein
LNPRILFLTCYHRIISWLTTVDSVFQIFWTGRPIQASRLPRHLPVLHVSWSCLTINGMCELLRFHCERLGFNFTEIKMWNNSYICFNLYTLRQKECSMRDFGLNSIQHSLCFSEVIFYIKVLLKISIFINHTARTWSCSFKVL